MFGIGSKAVRAQMAMEQRAGLKPVAKHRAVKPKKIKRKKKKGWQRGL